MGELPKAERLHGSDLQLWSMMAERVASDIDLARQDLEDDGRHLTMQDVAESLDRLHLAVLELARGVRALALDAAANDDRPYAMGVSGGGDIGSD